MGMFNDLDLKEKLKENLIVIIPTVLLGLSLILYCFYPLIFGIVEEKSEEITVINKTITKEPMKASSYKWFSSYTSITIEPEKTHYVVETSRNIKVFKIDKNKNKNFIKEKKEIKKHDVSEEVYKRYKIGDVLYYEPEINKWLLKDE